VILPLRDRNGDVIGAVRVVAKSFPGQTEKSAVEQAAPVVKRMQQQVHDLSDLVQ
jgi:DNA-binding IclR family transcriptional regulator